MKQSTDSSQQPKSNSLNKSSQENSQSPSCINQKVLDWKEKYGLEAIKEVLICQIAEDAFIDYRDWILETLQSGFKGFDNYTKQELLEEFESLTDIFEDDQETLDWYETELLRASDRIKKQEIENQKTRNGHVNGNPSLPVDPSASN